VSVHSHILPHSQVSLLTHALTSPCLGREPKAKVATKNIISVKDHYFLLRFLGFAIIIIIFLLLLYVGCLVKTNMHAYKGWFFYNGIH
jgi:hypothetical protein